MNPAIHIQLSTLNDVLDANKVNVDPLDFAYFTTLTADQWGRAKSLAKRTTGKLIDSPYYDYMRSHGPVEKAGEFVFKSFLDYYCRQPYDVFFTDGNIYDPGFAVGNVTIDVHTRMLKRSTQNQNTTLNVNKFLLMVPEMGLARRADIYLFCGYSTETQDGYGFGWVTAEELATVELNTNIRHKAKCVSLHEVHPLNTLLNYISTR